MPLMRGSSPDVISENIREMMHAGHDQKQAIAASYNMAGKGRKKKKKKRATPAHPMPSISAHDDTDDDDGY